MSDILLSETRGHLRILTMNRPERMNALSPDLSEALIAAFVDAGSDPDVRCVVLSGEGRGFCAGLDMASMARGGSGTGIARNDQGSILPQHVTWGWRQLPMPVIAAVHGVAFGGGFQIMSGACIRIAAPDTRFAIRETHWGLVPDMTGTFMIAQLVGADIAKELVFTARIFDGREAKALGLATHLSDNPYDDAKALAAEIAQRSPDAVRAAKALMNGLLLQGAAEQFAAERSGIGSLVGRANQREAVMSYFEQRPANFVEPQ